MPYALAIMGLLLFAKAIDEASKDSLHFGWTMAGFTCLVLAGGLV